MLQARDMEELIEVVGAMDRQTVTESLLSFRGTFPVDFTPEFLDKLSTDRLRHIFVALCMQSGHVPEMATAAA